jgi:hypothetical protein
MVKNVSKPIWLQARALKICMNKHCWIKYEIAYPNLEFFEIRLRVFLKNLRIFFKNVSKSVWVEAR